MNAPLTPAELRREIRCGRFVGNTSGYAQGHVQGNLCVLPADWANEFLQFCQSNPKPCPLIGMSASPGDVHIEQLGVDLDLRRDLPKYRIYVDGQLREERGDLMSAWREDLVAFVLGCSFSFEEALLKSVRAFLRCMARRCISAIRLRSASAIFGSQSLATRSRFELAKCLCFGPVA